MKLVLADGLPLFPRFLYIILKAGVNGNYFLQMNSDDICNSFAAWLKVFDAIINSHSYSLSLYIYECVVSITQPKFKAEKITEK